MTSATVSYEKAVETIHNTYLQYEKLSDLFKKDGLGSSDRRWVLRNLECVDSRLEDQVDFVALIFDLQSFQVWDDVRNYQ